MKSIYQNNGESSSSESSIQTNTKIAALSCEKPSCPGNKFYAEHVEQLMKWAGFRPCCSAELVPIVAASREHNRASIMRRVEEFFFYEAYMAPTGLETLPASWLARLPRILWSLRGPNLIKLPLSIARLEMSRGLLLVQFAQETFDPSNRTTDYDRIRVVLNASVYPNRWLPLKRRDVTRLEAIIRGVEWVAGSNGAAHRAQGSAQLELTKMI